jgi:uncharacterized alkaline shock family protein YloU
LTRSLALLAWLLFASRVAAAPTGPTLQFDYGQGVSPTNLICRFMYFVPLISPEPVTMLISPDNTQGARLLATHCRTNKNTFVIQCEFEFVGSGSLQNIFDHSEIIRRHRAELQAGETLTRQLGAINVTGTGLCTVEISGLWSSNAPVATKVQLHFDAHGKTSPVTINLQDLCYRDGKVQIEKEIIARINSLTFRHAQGTPKMEVVLDSIKRKDAGNSLWQNFVGGLKGSVANLFIPPLNIEAEGQQAMLGFGQALATQQSEFTFPLAPRLKNDPATKQTAELDKSPSTATN